MKFGVFYGSTTGNTESAAQAIKDSLGEFVPDEVINIGNASPEQLLEYYLLFLGISTWNIGELQDDWDLFLPRLDEIDLTGKKVALFGLGDAVGYAENFLDAMGILWTKCKERGAQLLGVWPSEEYEFVDSLARYDENHFVGLGLDEDNESDLTEERINNWLEKVVTELMSDNGSGSEAA